jgi:hypothetical protein
MRSPRCEARSPRSRALCSSWGARERISGARRSFGGTDDGPPSGGRLERLTSHHWLGFATSGRLRGRLSCRSRGQRVAERRPVVLAEYAVARDYDHRECDAAVSRDELATNAAWKKVAGQVIADYQRSYRAMSSEEQRAVRVASAVVRSGRVPRRFGKLSPVAYGLHVMRQSRLEPRVHQRRSVRTPRSRRIRTARGARSTGRSTDGNSDESDLAPRCPRCGGPSVLVRGLYFCPACWASTVLALEERAA